MKCGKRDLLLYAVTDRSWSEGTTLGAQVEEALRGGATFVQLREKKLTGEALRAEALEILSLIHISRGRSPSHRTQKSGEARSR